MLFLVGTQRTEKENKNAERLQAILSFQVFEDVYVKILRFWEDPLVLSAPKESRFCHFKVLGNSHVYQWQRLHKFMGGLSAVFR